MPRTCPVFAVALALWLPTTVLAQDNRLTFEQALTYCLQEGGKGFLQEAGSQAAKALFASSSDGQVSTSELNRLLAVVKETDQAHKVEIAQLQSALRERMTRDEGVRPANRVAATGEPALAEPARRHGCWPGARAKTWRLPRLANAGVGGR